MPASTTFKKALGLTLFGIGAVGAVSSPLAIIRGVSYRGGTVANMVGQVIGGLIVMALLVLLARIGWRMAQLDSN